MPISNSVSYTVVAGAHRQRLKRRLVHQIVEPREARLLQRVCSVDVRAQRSLLDPRASPGDTDRVQEAVQIERRLASVPDPFALLVSTSEGGGGGMMSQLTVLLLPGIGN